jgi:hypothetical protein
MMIFLGNPFRFVCTSNQMILRVFDTQVGAQGMESICELWHCLALLLPQCDPSNVLVFIVPYSFVELYS